MEQSQEQILKKTLVRPRKDASAPRTIALIFALFFSASPVIDAHSFVLCSQLPQLSHDLPVLCRFCGCQLSLIPSSPTLLPEIGKNPCAIIFGTKFKQVLADDNTVRCTSRKPGRDDYLWYDIELVIENQDEEDRQIKEPRKYHWIIKKRDLAEVPLRIPEYAIVINLPANFIDKVFDEHIVGATNTFYLPTFTLKPEITKEQLEDFLAEAEMRQIKDKRFFSTTTPVGTVPPAVQILNS